MSIRHIVLSLAAVFAALAIGVVLGARVLSGPHAAYHGDGGLTQQVSTLTDETSALREQLSAADEFDAQMSARIVRDTLAGKSVALIRTPDAEDSDVDALRGLIEQAAGAVTGTIALTPEFVDGDSAEKLRSVVVSPIVPAGAQLSTTLTDAGAQAGDLLGIALLINRDPAVAPAGEAERDTVLAALRDTGFLTYAGAIGAADTALVVTGGALPADSGTRGATVARFAAAMAPHGSGTVLAGRLDPAGTVSAVAVTRADAGLSGALSTVDDVDTAAGRITAVLALRAMADGAPAQQYGVGPGATARTVTR